MYESAYLNLNEKSVTGIVRKRIPKLGFKTCQHILSILLLTFNNWEKVANNASVYLIMFRESPRDVQSLPF